VTVPRERDRSAVDGSPEARPVAAEIGDDLAAAVRRAHARIRDRVVASIRDGQEQALRQADDSMAGDTIYAIDRLSESALLEILAQELAGWLPLIVVAEGLPDVGHGPGTAVLPPDAKPADACLRVIVDPIDGTRGLMYGKRSAWILTGVAPERLPGGRVPTLADIEAAVQTEIPPPKQTLADVLWAVRGRGVHGSRTDLTTGRTEPLAVAPSSARSIEHGFGQVMRAFPGGRDLLGAIDDDICAALTTAAEGKAATFEDQYISTGGQVAELVYGHDRWVADLRPLLAQTLRGRGQPRLLCCHPYDLCTALVAQEAGVLLGGPDGADLTAALVTDEDIAWVGYANAHIRDLVQPALAAALRARGLAASPSAACE
jgi:hypothetical protein